jgi:hypothetical protein
MKLDYTVRISVKPSESVNFLLCTNNSGSENSGQAVPGRIVQKENV